MNIEARYQQARRATVARSVLDVIAIIFLGCAFAFWGVAFWQLLAPPALLSLLSIQAVVLALVYALATPLLWSMLVPTTPAGQLLQKTQWKTIGFAFVVASAIYLSYQAEWMIESWLYAQQAIAEAGMQRSLAISLSIAFILIPALAWVQLTPERWLAQIQQAHQVKKLEMMQRGELAIIRATLLKAERYALVGYVNLLPHEREEVFTALHGLMRGIIDQQRAIARTIGVSADLEREFEGDADVAANLDSVKSAIEASDIRLLDAPPHVAPRERVRAPEDAPHAHVDSRPQSSIRREPVSDTVGQSPIESDSVARRIAAELPRIFTAQNLADLVQQDKRTAQRTIATWLEEGIVEQVQLGRYALKRGT